MQITKNKLKKIIAEELQNILTENWQAGNPYTSAQSYIRRQRPRGLRYSDTAELRGRLPSLDMDLSGHSRFFDHTPEEIDNQLNRMVNNLANTEYALQHMTDTGELPGMPGQKVSLDLFDRYFKLADIQRAGINDLARETGENPLEEDVTKNKLKKIIQEELAMLKEAWGRPEVVQGQVAKMENEELLSFFLEWASKGAPAGNIAKDELLRRLVQANTNP